MSYILLMIATGALGLLGLNSLGACRLGLNGILTVSLIGIAFVISALAIGN